MWRTIRLKTTIKKGYEKLTRFNLTFFKNANVITANNLEKIKMIGRFERELKETETEMLTMQRNLHDISSLLVEGVIQRDIFMDSLKSLDRLMIKHNSLLEGMVKLKEKEMEDSHAIWKILYGAKILLHESIRIFGELSNKYDSSYLKEQEKEMDKMINAISIINKTNRKTK